MPSMSASVPARISKCAGGCSKPATSWACRKRTHGHHRFGDTYESPKTSGWRTAKAWGGWSPNTAGAAAPCWASRRGSVRGIVLSLLNGQPRWIPYYLGTWSTTTWRCPAVCASGLTRPMNGSSTYPRALESRTGWLGKLAVFPQAAQASLEVLRAANGRSCPSFRQLTWR